MPQLNSPIEKELLQNSSGMRSKMKSVPCQIAAMNGIALQIGTVEYGLIDLIRSPTEMQSNAQLKFI